MTHEPAPLHPVQRVGDPRRGRLLPRHPGARGHPQGVEAVGHRLVGRPDSRSSMPSSSDTTSICSAPRRCDARCRTARLSSSSLATTTPHGGGEIGGAGETRALGGVRVTTAATPGRRPGRLTRPNREVLGVEPALGRRSLDQHVGEGQAGRPSRQRPTGPRCRRPHRLRRPRTDRVGPARPTSGRGPGPSPRRRAVRPPGW